MGCGSSALPNTRPENICGDGDAIGMQVDVPNACFYNGSIGSLGLGVPGPQRCFGQHEQSLVGASFEWQNDGGGAFCGVCSSTNGLGCGSGDGSCLGVCGGACSWGGRRLRCKRVAFNGDPLACCRRSQQIHGQNYCFEKDDKIATCDPIYRGFLEPGCQPLMTDFCSNNVQETMVDKWNGTPATDDCLRFVAENSGDRNAYKPVIEAMVSEYLITQNKPITSALTSPNHDPFIDTIVQVCRDNVGACDDVLKTKCQGVTREQLQNNVNLANLCGCFLEDVEYAKYSSFGVELAKCDPVCVIASAVPKWDSTTNNPALPDKCEQSLCIIDDVTVNVLGGSNTGDINFSQACGDCSDSAGSCRCFITDTLVQALNSNTGDISINQQCGGGAICFKEPQVLGGPVIAVDCDTGVPIDPVDLPSSNTTSGSSNIFNIIIGILMALLILAFLYIILRELTRPRTKKVYTRQRTRSRRPRVSLLRA